MKKSRQYLGFILFFILLSNTSIPQEKMKIAVLYFKDTSMNRSYSNFVEGLPDMLMTDLGQSDVITLVERLQINEAIRNFEIERSGYIDESTAIKVGKWLGTDAIILGNFSSIGGNARIDARVVDIESGTLIKSAKVQGKTDELYDLVDLLAEEILRILTGETKLFREVKKMLVDRVFTLKFPPPSFSSEHSPRAGRYYDIHRYTDTDNPSIKFSLAARIDTADIKAWRNRPSWWWFVGIKRVNISFRDRDKYPVIIFSIDLSGGGSGDIVVGIYRISWQVVDIDIIDVYKEPGGALQSIKEVEVKIKVERIDT